MDLEEEEVQDLVLEEEWVLDFEEVLPPGPMSV